MYKILIAALLSSTLGYADDVKITSDELATRAVLSRLTGMCNMFRFITKVSVKDGYENSRFFVEQVDRLFTASIRKKGDVLTKDVKNTPQFCTIIGKELRTFDKLHELTFER